MNRIRIALSTALAFVALAAALARPAHAEPFVYDTTPTHVVLAIETKGGYESKLQELTALPDFILYGDGTAVWTRHDTKNDLRVLMTARLSPDDVQRELEYLMSSGFLQWYDRYDRISLPNLPTTTVRLDLKSGTTSRMVYGLALALRQKVAPEEFGQVCEHFRGFRYKDEYEYPIDNIRLFVRKLTKAEARRGYRTLGWGVKKIVLSDIASSGNLEYGEKVFTGKDAERIVNRLRNWTLFSTELSVIFFKDKKEEFQVGYRPVLPHE